MIDFDKLVGYFLPCKVSIYMLYRVFTNLRQPVLIIKHFLNFKCEGPWLFRRDMSACHAVLNAEFNTTNIGADNRRTAGHGFDGGYSKRFIPGCRNK